MLRQPTRGLAGSGQKLLPAGPALVQEHVRGRNQRLDVRHFGQRLDEPPAGFTLRDGRAVNAHPWSALFANPFFWSEYVHMCFAGYIVCGLPDGRHVRLGVPARAPGPV